MKELQGEVKKEGNHIQYVKIECIRISINMVNKAILKYKLIIKMKTRIYTKEKNRVEIEVKIQVEWMVKFLK